MGPDAAFSDIMDEPSSHLRNRCVSGTVAVTVIVSAGSTLNGTMYVRDGPPLTVYVNDANAPPVWARVTVATDDVGP
jgi:hypothetical protein